MKQNILWVLIVTLMGFLNPLNLSAEDSSGPLEKINFQSKGKNDSKRRKIPPCFIPNVWAERTHTVGFMIILGPLATTALTIYIENEEEETIYQ